MPNNVTPYLTLFNIFYMNIKIIIATFIALYACTTVAAQQNRLAPEPLPPAIARPPVVVEEDNIANLTFVDIHPTYPDGERALMNYLSDSLQYPQAAKDSLTRGRVFVSFVVETNGTLSDIKVVRGLPNGCNEEALRLVSNMPKWSPGYKDKRAVRVRYNLPILFLIR
jgi:periplasmic protein TonB